MKIIFLSRPIEIRRKQKEIAEVGEKLKYSDPNLNIPFIFSKLEIYLKLNHIKIGTICKISLEMTDKLQNFAKFEIFLTFFERIV